MNTLDPMSVWSQPLPAQLLQVLFGLADSDAFPAFLRDVLTEKEITEIAARFEAARLLAIGVSYATIQKQTKLSTRTIARISRWLKNGQGGYTAALESLRAPQISHSHTSPVRAE